LGMEAKGSPIRYVVAHICGDPNHTGVHSRLAGTWEWS
jgi:hypothetical protein